MKKQVLRSCFFSSKNSHLRILKAEAGLFCWLDFRYVAVISFICMCTYINMCLKNYVFFAVYRRIVKTNLRSESRLFYCFDCPSLCKCLSIWDNYKTVKACFSVYLPERAQQACFSAYLQGVQENLCFITIHCNPSLIYIAVRDLQSSQLNASVQSLLLAGNFLYNQ